MLDFFRRSLQNKILGGFLLVSLLPAIIFAVYTVTLSSREYLSLAKEQHLALAREKAERIERALTEPYTDLFRYAQQPQIKKYINAKGESAYERVVLNALQTFSLKRADVYYELELFDLINNKIIAVNTLRATAGVKHLEDTGEQYAIPFTMFLMNPIRVQPLALETNEEGNYYSPFVPFIKYSLQIYDDEGKTVALLSVKARVSYIMKGIDDAVGNAEAFLFDRNSHYLFGVETNLLYGGQRGLPASYAIDHPKHAKNVTRRVAGAIEISEDGASYVGAFHRIRPKEQDAIQWTILYRTPRSIVMKPVAGNIILIIVTTVASLVLATFLMLVVTRPVMRPLHELSRAAKSLGKGHFHEGITIPKTKDEIGLLTKSFNEMISELHKMYESLEDKIAALKESESNLSESRENLSVTLDSIGDGVVVTNAQGDIMRMNPVAEKLTGWKTERVRGMNINDIFTLINAYTRKPVANPVDLVLKEGKTQGLANHTVLISKSGVEYQIADSAAPIRKHDGALLGVVIVFRDVTEQYRIAEALRVSEERFRLIVRSMSDFIFTLNKELCYTGCFGTWIEEFGFTEDRLLGKNIDEVWDDTNAAIHAEHAISALKGYERIYEWTYKEHLYQIRLSPIKDNDAYTIGVVGVGRDIKSIKQAEERVRIYAKQLEQSNQDLEQFAYVASHDLQEPLRTVTSYVQLIEKRYADKLDESGREFISFAVEGAKRMHTLINDLLQYSRIQTQEKSFEKIDAKKLVAGVLERLTVLIHEEHARVVVDNLPTIYCDTGQLPQVFQNLITNAIRFKRDERLPEIVISAEERERDYLFSVKDNGEGFPEESKERIFVIFQQVHAKSKAQGSGMGLAICKRIIERHNGKIWATSKPDEGATFFFTIPK